MQEAKKIYSTAVIVLIELLGLRQSMIHQDHDARALTRMDINTIR